MSKPADPRQAMSFLVLCGGAGSRMGGQDKPLLPWADHTMVDAVLASVPGEVPKLISANRNLSRYAQRARVVTDADTGLDIASPLTGILSGLLACDTEWLLVAPGDTPRLLPGWHEPLLDAADGADALVAHDGSRQQHLHLLLRCRVLSSLRSYLRGGEVAAWRWLATVGARAVDVRPAGMFANVNTPENLLEGR